VCNIKIITTKEVKERIIIKEYSGKLIKSGFFYTNSQSIREFNYTMAKISEETGKYEGNIIFLNILKRYNILFKKNYYY
jgi:hypothetical protein